MSLFSTMNTAVTGLRVASQGLNVTSHNVANATTEGFSQRELRVQTALPGAEGRFGIGSGAFAVGARRATDILVNERLVRAVGQEARSGARFQTLSVVEASLDESSDVGPATLMGKFFDSMSRLTQDPGDTSLREDVLTSAQSFSDGVNRLAIDMRSARQSIYEELEQTMASINLRLEQVAKFNAAVGSAGSELAAGDFQDQRDQVIDELAEEFGFTVEFTGDGLAQLSLGGHAVVTGAVARSLEVEQSTGGTPKVSLSADSATIDVTGMIGGYFGGRIDADNDIAAFEDELNAFIDTLGTALNTQHAAGFDRSGAAGGDLFTFTAGSEALTFTLDGVLAADTSLFAAAGAATASAGDGANLAALVDIESALLFAGGTQSATEALGSVYASVGRAVATSELNNATQNATLDDLTSLRTAISGVDLDQEAADLLGWQASYEAASRVVTATNDMLSELMELVR
jgi:flagellar hook-associated protein 1 FlgK